MILSIELGGDNDGNNLLVGKDVAADLTLPALYKFHVCFHTSLGVVLGENVRDVGVRVETTKLKQPCEPFPPNLTSEMILTVMNCQTKPSLPNSQT